MKYVLGFVWIDCVASMPEPNRVVLTSCGASWELAYWSRPKGWRADDASRRSLDVVYWGPVPHVVIPVSRLEDRSPHKLTIVLAEERPYIAFRDNPRAPLSEWCRRSYGMPDEPLSGVTHWQLLPRLPEDPQGGFYM